MAMNSTVNSTNCLSNGIMWDNWTNLLNICNCDPTMDYPTWPISCPSVMACQYCNCKNSTTFYNGSFCWDSVCFDEGLNFCTLRAGQRVIVSGECPSNDEFHSCWQCGYGQLNLVNGTCECLMGFTGPYCDTVDPLHDIRPITRTYGERPTDTPTRGTSSNSIAFPLGAVGSLLFACIMCWARYRSRKSDCTGINPADSTPVNYNHANESLSYYGSTVHDVPTHSTHPGQCSSHDGSSSFDPTSYIPHYSPPASIAPSPTALPNSQSAIDEDNDRTAGISCRRESVPPTYENAVLDTEHHPPSRQESTPPTYEQAIQKR